MESLRGARSARQRGTVPSSVWPSMSMSSRLRPVSEPSRSSAVPVLLGVPVLLAGDELTVRLRETKRQGSMRGLPAEGRGRGANSSVLGLSSAASLSDALRRRIGGRTEAGSGRRGISPQSLVGPGGGMRRRFSLVIQRRKRPSGPPAIPAH